MPALFPPRMALGANILPEPRNRLEGMALYASFETISTREAAVALSLRLDVLAVCAVFAFVGAILLGAF